MAPARQTWKALMPGLGTVVNVKKAFESMPRHQWGGVLAGIRQHQQSRHVGSPPVHRNVRVAGHERQQCRISMVWQFAGGFG